MQTVKWGIIGCGNVTEIKSGPAFNKVGNSELVAVMRRNAAKAEDYARRHQVATWYSNAEDLLNDPHVNAIYIATPPASHLQYALSAIEAGKPVYLEKPMTTDTSSAKKLLDAVTRNNAKLTVAHYRRALPYFNSIIDIIKSGKIGKVSSVHLVLSKPFSSSDLGWRVDPAISGGGLFHDLAPHQLDFLYHCFGLQKKCEGRSFNSAGHYNADDNVEGEIVFASGVRAYCRWSFAANTSESVEYCEFRGTEGVLKFDFFSMKSFSVTEKGKTEVYKFETLPHVQQPMIERVVKFFRGESENPCSCTEGWHIMQMMEALTHVKL